MATRFLAVLFGLLASLVFVASAQATPVVYDIIFTDPDLSGQITFDDADFAPSASIVPISFTVTDAYWGAVWTEADDAASIDDLFGNVNAAGTDVESLSQTYAGIADTVLPGGGFYALLFKSNLTIDIDAYHRGTYSLVAVPVPEPSTALLCALGLVWMARARRHH